MDLNKKRSTKSYKRNRIFSIRFEMKNVQVHQALLVDQNKLQNIAIISYDGLKENSSNVRFSLMGFENIYCDVSPFILIRDY